MDSDLKAVPKGAANCSICSGPLTLKLGVDGTVYFKIISLSPFHVQGGKQTFVLASPINGPLRVFCSDCGQYYDVPEGAEQMAGDLEFMTVDFSRG
jgi:hypothetical protein